MYINIEFVNGNPYITKTEKEFFRMLCKYHLIQLGTRSFFAIEERQWNGSRTRDGYKDVLRGFAIDWQNDFGKFNWSYMELADWESFFESMGRKYGLLREFRTNGIC